ncbi:hypothetical protein [Lentilactobacillus kribbianus]|uniref:hypothetical protein n=1 Tax=Lentilactobacillus kribbianus TaxID=2729622 RepID=UPI0015555E58|nr:hypothetical protein [Lentilactobacillus kribbianus]
MNEEKIDSKSQIVIGNAIYKNITVVDSDNQPVAVIDPEEIVELNGYHVLFNIGEDN